MASEVFYAKQQLDHSSITLVSMSNQSFLKFLGAQNGILASDHHHPKQQNLQIAGSLICISPLSYNVDKHFTIC